MKKGFHVYIICVMFFVSCFFAGEPGQCRAQSEDQLKTVKEKYDYAHWAAETNKVIPGLTISPAVLSQLEGMTKEWGKDICRVESIGGNTYTRMRQWWKSADGQIEIIMVVCPTFSAAKEYLISAYANRQIAPQITKSKGSRSGLNVGNVCYATPVPGGGFSDIDFIRHNVIIMLQARGDSRDELGAAAGTLDQLLSDKTREESYAKLKDVPTITRFSCGKAKVRQGKRIRLNLEVNNPAKGELRYFWEMSGGGVKKDHTGNFVYYAGDEGRHTIKVTVLNDLGLQDTKSLQIEVVE
jgi:hypothetical protein